MPPAVADRLDSPAFRWTILATIAATHALWLLHAWPARSVRPSAIGETIQVVFLAAPQRPPPPSPTPPRTQRPATPDPAAQARPTPPASASIADQPAAPAADDAPRVDTTRIFHTLDAVLREQAGQVSTPRRDPTRRYAARLPGRDRPYTPTAITLRRQITPEDVVKAIGVVFGADHDPCPSTESRLRDLVARNELVGEAELHTLIDQERRLCR